ncbi:hypothetical protein P7C70_g1958, partial [Phenoliferia sp. Uapishka_3]
MQATYNTLATSSSSCEGVSGPTASTCHCTTCAAQNKIDRAFGLTCKPVDVERTPDRVTGSNCGAQIDRTTETPSHHSADAASESTPRTSILSLPTEVIKAIIDMIVEDEIENRGHEEGNNWTYSYTDIREYQVRNDVLLKLSALNHRFTLPRVLLRDHVFFDGNSHHNERAKTIARRTTPLHAKKVTIFAHGRLSPQKPGVFAAVSKLEGVQEFCLDLRALRTEVAFPLELMFPPKLDGKSLHTGHSIRKLKIHPGYRCEVIDFASSASRNTKVQVLAAGAYLFDQDLSFFWFSILTSSSGSLRILTFIYPWNHHSDFDILEKLLPNLHELESLTFIGEGAERLLPIVALLPNLRFLHTTALFTPKTFTSVLSRGKDGICFAFQKLKTLAITDQMMGDQTLFSGKDVTLSAEERKADEIIREAPFEGADEGNLLDINLEGLEESTKKKIGPDNGDRQGQAELRNLDADDDGLETLDAVWKRLLDGVLRDSLEARWEKRAGSQNLPHLATLLLHPAIHERLWELGAALVEVCGKLDIVIAAFSEE